MMNIECDKQMMRYHINIQSKYGKLLLNSFNAVLWDCMHTYARVSHELKPVQKSFRGVLLLYILLAKKQNKTAPISKLIKVFSRVNLYYDLWMNKGVNVCELACDGEKNHFCSFKLNIFLLLKYMVQLFDFGVFLAQRA